jgi:hypothetical protein
VELQADRVMVAAQERNHRLHYDSQGRSIQLRTEKPMRFSLDYSYVYLLVDECENAARYPVRRLVKWKMSPYFSAS